MQLDRVSRGPMRVGYRQGGYRTMMVVSVQPLAMNSPGWLRRGRGGGRTARQACMCAVCKQRARASPTAVLLTTNTCAGHMGMALSSLLLRLPLGQAARPGGRRRPCVAAAAPDAASADAADAAPKRRGRPRKTATAAATDGERSGRAAGRGLHSSDACGRSYSRRHALEPAGKAASGTWARPAHLATALEPARSMPAARQCPHISRGPLLAPRPRCTCRAGG